MTLPGDAFEAGLMVARVLDARGISYALRGALAYGQYGIPRATNDVDVNVFVESESLAVVFDALRNLGITVDDAAARAAADREGMIVLRFGDYRLDVFTPSIAFSWEAGHRRSRAARGGPGSRARCLVCSCSDRRDARRRRGARGDVGPSLARALPAVHAGDSMSNAKLGRECVLRFPAVTPVIAP